MGLLNWFKGAADTLKNAAQEAVEATRKFAEEAKRELERAVNDAQRTVDKLTSKVRDQADEIKHDIEKAIPSFNGKLQEIIDDITLAASDAADEGIDISESINGAVEIVFQQIEQALQAAISAVNKFLHDATDRLFRLLEGIIPNGLSFLLKPVRSLVDFLLISLDFFADKLKDGVSLAVRTIKEAVKTVVRKITEMLGPVWEWMKRLWKLLFGTEPEQCSITAQWFDERMKRIEKQLLNDSPKNATSKLIRKATFLELLPPDENSWRKLTSEFLNRRETSPVWASYETRLDNLLQNTTPRDGGLVQVTMNEKHTDRLGGRQRVQITVLHYRWRTESFRKVSSGFLGIIAMVSILDTSNVQRKMDFIPTQKTRRDEPLQMDAARAREIYKLVEPSLWLRRFEDKGRIVVTKDKKARTSLQLLSKSDDGMWREVR